MNKKQKEAVHNIAKHVVEKQKIAITGFTEYMSDYIFNNNYSFNELDIAYEIAKKKLRAEIQELYDKVN